jgi:2-polyprenyl-3-methyl-5-hydroxy-6-metoxy-1,4-benzoquinol methylase
MMMPRIVTAEMLDGMAPGDPAAMRSRKDLQRVHRAMGTRMILLRGLKAMTARHPKTMPLRILEIGAGDGSLMLGVARTRAPTWSDVELTLMDRQPLLDAATVTSYREVGWTVIQKVGDVIDWAADIVKQLDEPALTRWDLIVANLFLHHFESAQLALILRAVAKSSRRFFACEPRRDWLALAGSHMVRAIGANHVTREDSVLSVHAGFIGDELTDLWPGQDGPWQVQEYSAGLFSHCFRAERTGLD